MELRNMTKIPNEHIKRLDSVHILIASSKYNKINLNSIKSPHYDVWIKGLISSAELQFE